MLIEIYFSIIIGITLINSIAIPSKDGFVLMEVRCGALNRGLFLAIQTYHCSPCFYKTAGDFVQGISLEFMF